MRHLMLGAVALLAVGAITGAAAMPGHIELAPRTQPMLIQAQSPCPPGYHWEAEGYDNGKYRPAHCAKN